MKRVAIQPAAGVRVLDPATGRPLGPEPCEVELSSYWRRRLAEGAVSVARAAVPQGRESEPEPDPEQKPKPARGKRREK